MQRTFERLLAKGEIRNGKALLYQIAEGLLANEYRDRARAAGEESWEALVGLDGTGLDHLPQFQTYDFEDSDFAAEFDRAVRVLEPDPRDAFILGELRGLPSRESAEVLGVSHVTANERRAYATAEIRKELVR